MPLFDSETFESSWSCWKAARSAFEQSLKSYVLACAVFQGACDTGAYTTSERAKIEQILSHLDYELPTLRSSENILLYSRKNLMQIRNKSTTLISINKLPVETLVQIFTNLTAEDGCSARTSSHKSRYEAFGAGLQTVMSVCTYWRHVALRAKNLWAHIDYTTTSRTQARELLWLERSQGSPLFFHGVYPEHRSLGLAPMAYLTPYVRNFVSIEFSHYADLSFHPSAYSTNSRNAIDDTLDLWLTYGVPGTVRRLELCLQRKEDSILLGSSRIDFLSNHSARFLRPVRFLTLTGIALDWRSTVFHGLVDLRLDLLADALCPSIAEIAAILEASPSLETLKLSHMTIEQSSTTALNPIHLPRLKCLNLRGLKPRLLDILLTLIVSGSRDVGLSIGLKRVQFLSTGLLDFLRRTRVTTLFVYGIKQPQWFSQIMALLPHLENLAVHSGMLYEDMIPQRPSLLLGSSARSSGLRLYNLYLLSCQSKSRLLFRLCTKGIAETQKVFIWRAVKASCRIQIAPIDMTVARPNRRATSYQYRRWNF
ncbi:hypothetical protein BDV93DRAFT_510409 [Ceratobasidium sp. AG-I]|nr:hypothetical protein BDV93DRAFT_510409 [Ceratobasidium sp. AG-I]